MHKSLESEAKGKVLLLFLISYTGNTELLSPYIQRMDGVLQKLYVCSNAIPKTTVALTTLQNRYPNSGLFYINIISIKPSYD
jgi:hypothetical protein